MIIQIRFSYPQFYLLLLLLQDTLNNEFLPKFKDDTIAKNIANARTTLDPTTGLPYQRETVSFAPIMERVAGQPDRFVGIRVDEILKDDSPFEEVFDPSHPDADERGVVLYPNVNTMKEMADLVTAVRSYEANLSVQENFERMADRALRIAD